MVGLPAAGKSTVARRLAEELPAVRFGLDDWMIRLHGLTFDDEEYIKRLPPCREMILETAGDVLRVGVDVILDWNHWSPERRKAACDWAAKQSAGFVLHYVRTPVEVARRQAVTRVDERSHTLQAAGVDHALTYFVPPEAAEGNTIVLHKPGPSGSTK
jgi:predicted kinase